MKLTSNSIKPDARFDTKYTFCRLDGSGQVEMSDNVSPHLAWSDAPEGTKSFVLICFDSSVPSSGEDVNQEGKTVPASLPRVDFFHWVLVDIPAGVSELSEGQFANGITAKGKQDKVAHGMRQGLNDYTGWFAGDADMGGNYFGYDGPAPPWNDELIHQYHFVIYALDIDKLDVTDPIEGQAARKAMEGHVLAEARISATFTLNKDLA